MSNPRHFFFYTYIHETVREKYGWNKKHLFFNCILNQAASTLTLTQILTSTFKQTNTIKYYTNAAAVCCFNTLTTRKKTNARQKKTISTREIKSVCSKRTENKIQMMNICLLPTMTMSVFNCANEIEKVCLNLIKKRKKPIDEANVDALYQYHTMKYGQ